MLIPRIVFKQILVVFILVYMYTEKPTHIEPLKKNALSLEEIQKDDAVNGVVFNPI